MTLTSCAGEGGRSGETQDTDGSIVSQPVTMEYLDRGAVAVPTKEGVYLSWRLLGTEPYDTSFIVSRNGKLIATVTDTTNYLDPDGGPEDTYCIEPGPVREDPGGDSPQSGETASRSGEDSPQSGEASSQTASGEDGVAAGDQRSGETSPEAQEIRVLQDRCLSIPLQVPEGGTGEDGEPFSYTANDAACADLDGDGAYEIILKWDPTNSFDSGEVGRTSGKVYIDAYKLSGERLWRMDLGINIPAGPHFTQIAAYDFDLDGKAEIAFKTAPGTRDGTGRYVSEASGIEAIRNVDNLEDLRHTESGEIDAHGRALSGDEYYTVFQGDTGAALDTVYYPHPRGTLTDWGDDRGNRSERYLAAVAYLDGEHPFMITWRGYYGKTTADAYRLVDKRLVHAASFDTSEPGMSEYEGQGNHNLAVADVDGDGRDEILCGSLALDDDLSVLWCSGRGHGDALHLADYDPLHPGMEYFSVHETEPFGMTLYDAATGQELFHKDGTCDTRRGVMAHTGYTEGYFEMWGEDCASSYGNTEVREEIFSPASDNFRIFWDGDLYDDLLDGELQQESHVRINNRDGLIEVLPDGLTNNGTKNNVCLSADLFGDWREEIVVRSDDGKSLLIYTTTIPAEHKLYTLMHDRTYRMQAAAQNAGYNQPPHLGYYVSDSADGPDLRRDACRIRTTKTFAGD